MHYSWNCKLYIIYIFQILTYFAQISSAIFFKAVKCTLQKMNSLLISCFLYNSQQGSIAEGRLGSTSECINSTRCTGLRSMQLLKWCGICLPPPLCYHGFHQKCQPICSNYSEQYNLHVYITRHSGRFAPIFYSNFKLWLYG